MSVRRLGRSLTRAPVAAAPSWPSAPVGSCSPAVMPPPLGRSASGPRRPGVRGGRGASRRLQVCLELLAPADVGVPAAQGHELLVRALPDDAPGLEHVAPVAPAQGAAAVPDDAGRAGAAHLPEPVGARA